MVFNVNFQHEHKRLGGGTKVRYLRRCISLEEADFVCLQETKTTVVTDAKCFSM